MPFFFTYILKKHKDNLEEDWFKKSYSTLTEGLNPKGHPLAIYWNVLQLFRFKLTILIIVYFSDYPLYQLAGLALMQVLIMIFIIKVWPFEVKGDNQKEIYNQVFCLLFIATLITLYLTQANNGFTLFSGDTAVADPGATTGLDDGTGVIDANATISGDGSSGADSSGGSTDAGEDTSTTSTGDQAANIALGGTITTGSDSIDPNSTLGKVRTVTSYTLLVLLFLSAGSSIFVMLIQNCKGYQRF